MKKIISLVLVFVMAMSLGLVAFAEETNPLAPQSGEVTASYVPAESIGGTIYSIDVSWGSFKFTYYQASEPTWDPEKHEYSENPIVEEGWGDSQSTITIANNSNTHIKAVPSYTSAEGFEGITMNFSVNEIIISSADIYNREETGTITVTPSGVLSAETAENTKIGTITIALSESETPDADTMVSQMSSYITYLTGKVTGDEYDIVMDAEVALNEYLRGGTNYESLAREYISLKAVYEKYA